MLNQVMQAQEALLISRWSHWVSVVAPCQTSLVEYTIPINDKDVIFKDKGLSEKLVTNTNYKSLTPLIQHVVAVTAQFARLSESGGWIGLLFFPFEAPSQPCRPAL